MAHTQADEIPLWMFYRVEFYLSGACGQIMMRLLRAGSRISRRTRSEVQDIPSE